MITKSLRRCKRRRVKCDEGKPECQRCIRINVQCPGYNIPQPNIFGLIDQQCFRSDFEKLCFESFITVSIHDLASFQPSMKNFWKTFVPQLGQVYTAVRHAVIAISVLQEPAIRQIPLQASQNLGQDPHLTSLQHFNDSIRDFIQSSHGFRTEAKLTCCILYQMLTTCLEKLPAGTTHIRAADFLLKDHNKAVGRGEKLFDPIISGDFTPIIRHQVLHALVFVDGFQERNNDCGNRFEAFKQTVMSMPTTLDHFGEAHDFLLTLLEYALAHHFLHHQDVHLRQIVFSAIDSFETLLDDAAPSSNLAMNKSSETLTWLRYHYFRVHQAAIYMFAHTIAGEEVPWTHYMKQFKLIIVSAEAYLLSRNDQIWQATLGMIPPLFLVATKCRNRSIRQRAVELLHDVSAVENIWTSCMATLVARTVFRLEEMPESAGQNVYVTLLGLKIHDAKAEAVLSYRIRGVDGLEHEHNEVLTYAPPELPPRDSQLGQVQDRVLQAAGYSGLILRTHRIRCHCKR